MKKLVVNLFALSIVALPLATALPAQAAGPTTWNVPGDGSGACKPSDPSCTTISAAITAAAPGDTIKVAAGTYPEQLTITKSLTLIGAGTKTIIAPASVNPVTDYFSTVPILPVVIVQNAANVNIENLEVNAATPGAAVATCDANLSGIVYQDASGAITDTTVTNVENSPAYFGCQGGLAIFVEFNGSNGTPTVNIQKNTITNYDKNGVTCIGNTATEQAVCNVSDNVITGIGETNLIAQNGIQMGPDASGVINGNQVSGDSYAVEGCPSMDYFSSCFSNNAAAGLLLYDALPGTVISNNKVSASDMGIIVENDNAPGDATTVPYLVSGNTLQENYGYGLIFDSANGTSTDNLFQGNPVGLLVTDSYNDSTVTSLNDQFVDNSVNDEALSSGSTTLSENLIVETAGFPFHLPSPGPHAPHLFGFGR